MIDDAGELTHASYFDVDGHETVISTPVTDNPMLPEVRDFARVLNDPELLPIKLIINGGWI